MVPEHHDLDAPGRRIHPIGFLNLPIHFPQFGADCPNVSIRVICRMEGIAGQRRLTSRHRSFESNFHRVDDLRMQSDMFRGEKHFPAVSPRCSPLLSRDRHQHSGCTRCHELIGPLPLLVQSGHGAMSESCPLSGGKADMRQAARDVCL